MDSWFKTHQGAGNIPLKVIPQVEYAQLYAELDACLSDSSFHVVAYFAVPSGAGLSAYCLVCDDASGLIYVATYRMSMDAVLPSLTARHTALHTFEREMAELYGVVFEGSPWPKPLRYAHDRADRRAHINNYPFYTIKGESLHEVNVGPIHAGIIEPGCFRFICNGEQILHLEIVLGYQHRGVEHQIRRSGEGLRSMLLCESVAGDSVVAHATAHAQVLETLSEVSLSENLIYERAIALEMERIAMHLADTGALCMDIGYQLGQVACEALRTLVINATQRWCGNRFAKGLIRPAGTHYPMNEAIREHLLIQLEEVERRYSQVVHNLEVSPSVLSRFEDCGIVSRMQLLGVGAVGLTARASGLLRDLRATHPWGVYTKMEHRPIVCMEGDVAARLKVRMREVRQSIAYVREWLENMQIDVESRAVSRPDYSLSLAADSLAFSLVEGWRGEVVHVGLTDENGRLVHYKIKDPSQHNWRALALSVRDLGISDFPICNKSFNLSYCGHDL